MTAQLVIGAGGLLGSALTRASESFPVIDVVGLNTMPWGNPERARETLRTEIRTFLLDHRGKPWRMIWAAGVGRVSADTNSLRSEAISFQEFCGCLLEADADTQAHGQVVFASSAGALYAGHAAGVIDPLTSPAPINDYGWHKLTQETQLVSLSQPGSTDEWR